MCAAVQFCKTDESHYFTIVSVSEQQQQLPFQRPAETNLTAPTPRSPTRSILSNGSAASSQSGRVFRQKPQPNSAASSSRSSALFARRRQKEQEQQQQQQQQKQKQQKQKQQHNHHHHKHPGLKRQSSKRSATSRSSRSSRGSRRSKAPSPEERRQLSIINAVSFLLFSVNLLAAVAILIEYSFDFTGLNIFNLTRPVIKEEHSWLSLSIGSNEKKCQPEHYSDCHEDKSSKYYTGANPIPLKCSDWSKDSVDCKNGIQGPNFQLEGQSNRIKVKKAGYYRIHMMVTSCSNKQNLPFEIRVNNQVWAACYPRSISDSSNPYTRCYSIALRYLKPDEDYVSFNCGNATSICCASSFDRLTHFGLERRGS